MKNRGLIALLIAGFLSCSTISNITQRQYSAPKKILMNVSDGVSLIEDTDGDGILDTTFNYKVTLEKKPDYIPGNQKDFYFIEFKSEGTIVPLLNKDETPAPILPEEKTKYFNENLKRDACWRY